MLFYCQIQSVITASAFFGEPDSRAAEVLMRRTRYPFLSWVWVGWGLHVRSRIHGLGLRADASLWATVFVPSCTANGFVTSDQ